MIEHILDLSKQLITVQSVKGSGKELFLVLDMVQAAVGTGVTVERFERNGSPSMLLHNRPLGTRNFTVILNGHLDVVPGNPAQYVPVEKDGRLYGRGAYDMKAATAAEALVFADIARKVSYPIALQIVTDEEIGGFDGTKYQVDEGVRAEFAIAGEGTDLDIKNEAKGVLWATIQAKGKSSHAAYPWQGTNAIRTMTKVLRILEKAFPEPHRPVWKTTMNIATISTTNQTYNKVAGDCTVGIDIRYVPDETDTIVTKLKRLLPDDVELSIGIIEPAQFTAKNNAYVGRLQQTVSKLIHRKVKIVAGHHASDIRHFNRAGCDGVEFGPVGYGLHTDCEWVDVRSLGVYYDALKKFLLGL